MTCEGYSVRWRDAERPQRAAEPRPQPEAKEREAVPFINPAGVIHKVACFAAAPGVRAVGEASAYWTWFPGFAWQVAVCRGCGEHIGWCFVAAEQRFVALLVERIIEEQGGAGSGA